MHVQRISLEHFRNHSTTTIDLGAGVNVLLGNNGQGKTNILEALSFIGLTKSFFGAADRVVPPKLGRAPAEALAKAGADVVFELLPGHDHDVWTDSYSDPMFYERLLSKRR